MAKARRKRRTSIRTAATTVQKAYLERVRALRDDPSRALPECPEGEPKAVAKVRGRLERIARGKIGFFDRRDKGVVGAVAHAVGLAELKTVPRLADQKVAGRRRFYLQRGHVRPAISLGVQNHDDPLALLGAWRDTAAAEDLHFFAGPGLWCTGRTPRPPQAWWDDLAQALDATLVDDGEGGRRCKHTDTAHLRLVFPEGPALQLCAACAGATKDLHATLMHRHAGPDRRRPVAIEVRTADGEETPLEREPMATFRAGAVSGQDLVRTGLRAWHEQELQAGRFVLGQTRYEDMDAFLAALEAAGAKPWERKAIAVMARDGHAGAQSSVSDILKAHMDRLPDGLRAVLGRDPAGFLDHQGKAGPRDVLRRAHEEAERRRRLEALPEPDGLGPMGHWVDSVARHARTHPLRETVQRLHGDSVSGAAPPHHVAAFLAALGAHADGGDDPGTEPEWVRLAQAVLESDGEAYLEALRAYLKRTGTGEVPS